MNTGEECTCQVSFPRRVQIAGNANLARRVDTGKEKKNKLVRLFVEEGFARKFAQ